MDVKAMAKKKLCRCIICDRHCTTLYSLRQHMRTIHKVINVMSVVPFAKSHSFKCHEENCNFCSYTLALLMQHLQTEHQMQFDVGSIEFESLEQFLTWKRNLEKETDSRFVQKAGAQLRQGGKSFSKYFKCYRTGFYKPNPKLVIEDKDRKKKPWKRGSTKQNAMCTAYIKLTKTDKNWEVVYCKTHYPHAITDQPIRLLPMEESIRMIFVQKISEGLPIDMIREDVLKVAPVTEIPKIQKFSNKEKNYILNEFKLSRSKDLDDGSVLEAWVIDMLSLGADSPIKIFKPKGVDSSEFTLEVDDLCLIVMTTTQSDFFLQYSNDCIVCVDSTVSLRIGHLELTTLIFLDEHGQVFPVAFMITNRHDINTVLLFFETVKDVTKQVTPLGFMSTDEELYYSAWAHVMGEVPKKYLSSWCVEIAMRKNLMLIESKAIQNRILRKIRSFLYDTENEDFSTDVTFFSAELLADPTTKKYAEFFQENYVERVELWANYYRTGLHSKSNENLEKLHNTLTQLYLVSKKERRLDRCLMKAIQLFSEKHLENEVSINAKKMAVGVPAVCEVHTQSLQTKADVRKVSETCWKIKSLEDSSYYCVVEKNTLPCCDFRCYDCQLCIHMYTCTCASYLIQNTICIHIHSLKHWLKINHSFSNTSSSMFIKLPPTEEEKLLQTDLTKCISLVQNVFNKDRLEQVEGHIKTALCILKGLSPVTKT